MAMVIFGCGGHARSVINAMIQDKNEAQIIPVDQNAGIEEYILGFLARRTYELKKEDQYIVAVGDNAGRKALFEKQKEMLAGKCIAVVSGFADVGMKAEIGTGTFVAPFAYIGPQAQIGFNTIINTGSIIEHETMIGNHTHIAPRAVVCGRSRIGNLVFCGAGSTVIDGIRICDNVTIGAGAVVTKDITEPGVYAGVPAKKIKNDQQTKEAVK